MQTTHEHATPPHERGVSELVPEGRLTCPRFSLHKQGVSIQKARDCSNGNRFPRTSGVPLMLVQL